MCLLAYFHMEAKSFTLCPQAPGTHFFQNGDPMGTQFSVKWGPNGDPHQQNGTQKAHVCKIDRDKLI